MNDVQAGGVRGGVADSSSPETPDETSRERLGKSPLADQGLSRSQVAESNPMMTIFGTFMYPRNSFPKTPLFSEMILNGSIYGGGGELNTESNAGLQPLDLGTITQPRDLAIRLLQLLGS